MRELENAIEHAGVVCTNRHVRGSVQPGHIVEQVSSVIMFPPRERPLALFDDRPSLDELCCGYMHLVLAEMDGNKSRAAEALGINRRTPHRYRDSNGEVMRVDERGNDDSVDDELAEN